MVGYREHRSAELIAIEGLSNRVVEIDANLNVMLKIQDSMIRILGQIKDAVTPQDGPAGDDTFSRLIEELLETGKDQVEGLARVEAALTKPRL
jgi:hypothetical protein